MTTSISTSSSADERDKENRKANEGAEARKGTSSRWSLRRKDTLSSDAMTASLSTSSSADERDMENRKANEGAEARKGTSSRWSLRRKDTLSSDPMTKTRKIEILEV
jgi:hypothetical protein